jgi:hypothetical protein
MLYSSLLKDMDFTYSMKSVAGMNTPGDEKHKEKRMRISPGMVCLNMFKLLSAQH